MSSITSRLSGLTFFWLPAYLLYRKKKALAIGIAFLLVVGLVSCFQQYYRTATKPTATPDMIQKLQAAEKYFILHLPDRTVGLENLSMKDSVITGTETALSEAHRFELDPNPSIANVVKSKHKDSVLMEVHLYTTRPLVNTGTLSLNVSDINRIDVYEFDKKSTKSNRVVSSIGLGLAIGVAALLIGLAIACNCPQVYVENNGNTQFNGGMYSGAVYSTLERTDYMPLPISHTDPTVKLTIANAPEEEQFINSVQLLQADHPSGTQVLADRHGKLLSFRKPARPIKAIAGNAGDVKGQLLQKDQDMYAFNNKADGPYSEVVLNFKRTDAGEKAKLVINGKNSNWSGYVFQEFNGLFGEGLEKWRIAQEKEKPEKLHKWQIDQALPLKVYLKQGNGWQYIDHFSLVGNTAPRDMIMELDLSNYSGDIITIKLETVYRFWDLDYAAIDLSPDVAPVAKWIDPAKAILGNDTDQRMLLAKQDGQYSQLKGNEAIKLEFNVDPKTGAERSYFLVSSGYYHSLRKYPGKANTVELLRFRNSGSFDAFSRSRYKQLNDQLASYAVPPNKQ